MKTNNQPLGSCHAPASRFIRFAPARIAGLFTFGPVAAQEGIFEEIIVTAQKREQNLMDVPVAVSTLSGAQIQESAIKDVFDLQSNVPSLLVGQSQTATTSNFSIRSVGSTSNNFAVESSVGLYVDGIYRSRQSSLINELVDIEAVEVLRGPQGTLFGKNTAAGAILMRTVRPTQETDAFVEVTAGDFGLARVSAAANIPFSDSVAFRGTVFSSQRDGYIDDLVRGSDFYNDRDRLGIRLQLAGGFTNDNLDWRLIADYSEIDETCCGTTTTVDNLFSRASLAGVPVNGSDVLLLGFGGTVITDFPYPAPFIDGLRMAFPQGTIIQQSAFEELVTTYDIAPESKNEDSGISFELNYTMENGMIFTSVSSVRSFDTLDRIDADFTDVPLLERINDAEVDSFSQEFRLAGEFGDSSNYVLGAYYFDQEVVNLKTTNDALLLSAFLNMDPRLLTIAGGVDAIASTFGALGYQPAGVPALPSGTSLDNSTHEQDGYAVFGQVDFALSDQFTLTLGARYTDENKDTVAIYTQATPSTQPRPDFGLMGILLCSVDPTGICQATLPPGLPSFDPFVHLPVFQPFFLDDWGIFAFDPLAPRPDINQSLQDDQTTGNVKLTWYPTDQTMFYASYSTGFKSGGINDERINPAFPQAFGPETSTSIELGFKGDLGRVRLGIAVYDGEFEDFQAQAFTGTGFNLQNAGDLSIQGVEVEFTWRPVDTFEVAGFYAHNEGEYDSFVDGTCWDATPFHTGQPDPGLPPAFNPLIALERCNRTGGKLPYNPEDRFFVALTKDFPMGDNNFFARVEYSYNSDILTDGDLDPLTFQDSFNLLNARVGYQWTDWDAELAIWGRNLTDERWFHGSFDAPTQDGHMNAYPSEPSTYGVTFRKNFGD